MKKALLLFFVLFSVLHYVDAQWHYESCGVIDINNSTLAEFECLWGIASKNVRVGSIATGIGAVGFGSSILMVTLIMGGEIDNGTFTTILTYAFIGAAITGLTLGPAFWITGASRKSRLRKNPHYEALKSSSLNISPSINRIHFNNSYSLGITASLSF